MKALLICPAGRGNVAALAENVPLAAAPMLGKSLLEYWIEHLVTLGAGKIVILASDRPGDIRAHVGDGSRWGVRAAVHSEMRELTIVEARAGRRGAGEADWLPAPHDVTLMEHLPGLPEFPLFTRYAGWCAAAFHWLSRAAAAPDRIGVREIQPGVWAGRRARVSPAAELRAPCWVGDSVYIGAEAVIGPNAVLENKAFVEGGAEISNSVIGEETFVGEFAEIHDSIAWGNTLVNWRLESCFKVPDVFLLCSLTRPRPPLPRVFQPAALEVG